jgi:putative ABC transport system ATP-binding protein
MQIVALLRALQLDPSVLLLDEPTAALDLKTAAAVEALVADWLAEGDSGRATVWVSHGIDQTRRMAGRLLVLDSGRILGEWED